MKDQDNHAAESHKRIWARMDEHGETLNDHESRIRVLESQNPGN